jgi:tRNA(Ile)-lysidine synthase
LASGIHNGGAENINNGDKNYMSLLKNFQQYIAQENLFSSKDRLLLAVSGGVDSVVLCELCQQAGYHFIIAHCNFQLRGDESERDENFVRQLGEKYGKQVLVKRFETEAYASANKVSIQVAARELRYAWFFSIADSRESIVISQESIVDRQSGETAIPFLQSDDSRLTTHDSRLMTHVVTAHHLDDNIETLLMNFFKGTGIAGLRGMLPKQGKIIRPLLFAGKEAIKQFAADHQLAWVEDSSNQHDKYARNYFRHQLIPLVKNIYPEAANNLAHNLDRFKDIELLYLQAIDQHKKKLLEYKGNEVHIPVLKLLKTIPLHSVVYEIINNYGFGPRQVEEVIGLLNSETGRYSQSATHRIIKNRNWLIISPGKTRDAENILVEGPGVVELVIGDLELVFHNKTQKQIPDSGNTAFLDAADITFPLLLRKWKTGDYFYPLGMKKKKKLSRFFIDLKLSKTEKEKIWVLEANKKIVWVVGHRIDDRCKITPQTKNILQVTLKALDIGSHLP